MPVTSGHPRPASAKRAARSYLSLLPAVLLIAACATGPQGRLPADDGTPAVPVAGAIELHELRTLVSLQDRLYRVAAPLLVNNTGLCKGNARNLLGFTAKNKYSYSTEFIDAAQQAMGLDEQLQVRGVLAGSGAARAGVLPGDVLLAVEQQPLPQGENAEREAAAVLAPLVMDRSSVKLTVLRSGTEVALHVPLTPACAFGIELGNTDLVGAYADGYRVLVTRGMMSVAAKDEELAYVIAKEMAHNALAHAARQTMSATIGGIIDNLTRIRPDMSTMIGMAGVKPMPPEYDVMADRLSLYMLARAGYNIDRAAPFWQRIASQYPATMLNSHTALHPAIDQRVAAMKKTVSDVKAKQANGKAVMP